MPTRSKKDQQSVSLSAFVRSKSSAITPSKKTEFLNVVTPQKKNRKKNETLGFSPYQSVTLASSLKQSHPHLDFSPFLKTTGKYRSPLNKEMGISHEELLENKVSPEKGRAGDKPAFTRRVGGCLSPPVPLVLSPCISPIGELSQPSPVPEFESSQPETLQRMPLLDTIQLDLQKSCISQISGGSSGLSTIPAEAREATVPNTINTALGNLRDLFVLKKEKSKSITGDEDILGTMKSTCQFFSSAWEEEKANRNCAMGQFQDVIQSVSSCMTKDLKEMKETEVKLTLLWTQQMEKLRNQRLSQGKELKRLRKAHDELIKQFGLLQMDHKRKQNTLKTVLKQDVDALKRKLFARYHERSLEAMKRCLQASFMYS